MQCHNHSLLNKEVVLCILQLYVKLLDIILLLLICSGCNFGPSLEESKIIMNIG